MLNDTGDFYRYFDATNADTLSRRGRESVFALLTDDEVARIETIYREAFAGDRG